MQNDTIIALLTPYGSSAVSVLRLSGDKSIEITDKFFKSKSGLKLSEIPSHKVVLGTLYYRDASFLDEVLITIFKAPNSYTGENVVEISCHGSVFIQKEILELFISEGIAMAKNGEFTMRAFSNGKLNLSQAEAVIDLIESESRSQHLIASKQLRGAYSIEIQHLREKLLDFASMIELELDFSEEDVEFADRSEFLSILSDIENKIKSLTESFKLGNAIKNGVSVAIIGEPNVGKSTLLNALLGHQRAIVSDIAGTTRDTIEDFINIGGIKFLFIDTAGIRQSFDEIEKIGIERSFEAAQNADVVLFLSEGKNFSELLSKIEKLEKKVILVQTKSDITTKNLDGFIKISAKTGQGIEELKNTILSFVKMEDIEQSTIVSNVRHFEALYNALVYIKNVKQALQNSTPTDLLAIDLRLAISSLGEITGEISSDEILGNIFGRFCIGK